jgi:hypothetical protein
MGHPRVTSSMAGVVGVGVHVDQIDRGYIHPHHTPQTPPRPGKRPRRAFHSRPARPPPQSHRVHPHIRHLTRPRPLQRRTQRQRVHIPGELLCLHVQGHAGESVFVAREAKVPRLPMTAVGATFRLGHPILHISAPCAGRTGRFPNPSGPRHVTRPICPLHPRPVPPSVRPANPPLPRLPVPRPPIPRSSPGWCRSCATGPAPPSWSGDASRPVP